MFVDIVTNVSLVLLWVFMIDTSDVTQPWDHMILVNDDVP